MSKQKCERSLFANLHNFKFCITFEGFSAFRDSHHSFKSGKVFYAPAMIMAGALSFTPVRPYVHTYVRTFVPTTSAL